MNKRERIKKQQSKKTKGWILSVHAMGQQFDIMLMRITMHLSLRHERIPKLFLRNKVRAQSAQLIRGKYGQYSTRNTCCSCQFPSYLQCTWKIQYKLRAFTKYIPYSMQQKHFAQELENSPHCLVQESNEELGCRGWSRRGALGGQPPSPPGCAVSIILNDILWTLSDLLEQTILVNKAYDEMQINHSYRE